MNSYLAPKHEIPLVEVTFLEFSVALLLPLPLPLATETWPFPGTEHTFGARDDCFSTS
jgi:hypothetical protein